MPKSIFSGQVADNAKEQKNRTSQYGHLSLPRGINLFQMAGGDRVSLDFLPYRVTDPKHLDRKDERNRAIPGSLWYKHPYRLHRGIGANNESIVCPTSIGRKCPICEFRKKLVAKNADKDDIRAVNASLRNLYVVVPLDHKEYEKKPHIWDISQFLFQDMLIDELGEDPESREIFPDLEEGLTLKIRFSEEQMGKNKFGKASRIDFVERKHQYTEKILKEVPNLDEILHFITYDEILEKFLEEDEDKPKSKSEDEEDEAPVRTHPSRHDKEDDEEEEEKEPVRPKRRVADDDEDEKPAKKRRVPPLVDEDEAPVRPKRRAVKDDDEEAPAPKQKGKAKATECPSDYVFGKDCDKYEECDKCPVWEDCFEAKDAMKGKTKVKEDDDDE
jgi:hypothetical protein